MPQATSGTAGSSGTDPGAAGGGGAAASDSSPSPSRVRPPSPKYEGFCEFIRLPASPLRGGSDSDGDGDGDGGPSQPRPGTQLPAGSRRPLRRTAAAAAGRGDPEDAGDLTAGLGPWARPGTRVLRPAAEAPRAERVASSLRPSAVYQQPYFGKRKDLLPSRNLNNRRFHIAANDLQSLCEG